MAIEHGQQVDHHNKIDPAPMAGQIDRQIDRQIGSDIDFDFDTDIDFDLMCTDIIYISMIIIYGTVHALQSLRAWGYREITRNGMTND